VEKGLKMVEPYTITVAGALAALGDLGLDAVIAVAGVLWLGMLIYKRFRK